jgi:hypothetical protein
MNTFFVRLMCVGLMGVFAIATHAQIPGSTRILNSKCEETENCGETSQFEACVNKTEGANCSFCSGAGKGSMCHVRPNNVCASGAPFNCGLLCSGTCELLFRGTILVCTGSVCSGECSVNTCS